MSLNLRAIAVKGVGYGNLAIAMNGYIFTAIIAKMRFGFSRRSMTFTQQRR